jgi:2-dehydropantoate 2-reductase
MLNVPDAVECYKKTAHYRVPVIIISSLLVIWALSYPIGVMTNAFTHTPLFGQVSQSFWSILLSNNASVEYNWVILVGITIGIVLFSYYDVFIKAEHTAIKRGAFYHPTGAKILIIGAGAIGGITGAYLTMAGEKVILFDTNQEHVHQMQDHGLEIIGKRGSLRVKIFAASSNEELIEQYQNLFEVPEGSPLFDFIILGVKSAYTEAAVKHIMPYMSPEGVICTVQNSINDQTIANLVGEDHVIHCVTMWGGTNLGPGKLEQTSLGPFDIGECGEVKDTPRIHTLQKILNNFASTKIFPDILKAAWRKLMLNGVMNTYGLIFGERCFELFNNPKILPIVMATIREEALVAKQIVGPLGSENMIPMDQFIFDQNLSLRGVQDRASVLKIISSISGRIKSSMLQDYEKGLKTENEYLLGYFIRENSKFAEQNNIEALPIPFIHRAFEVATKVENGELQPSMESHQIFNDLFDSMPAFWRDSNNFKLNTLGQRIILTLITAVGQIIAPK